MTETAFCHQPIIEQGGLYLSLFLAGLTGGFTHCAGMCGPFVLSIPSDTTSSQPLWQRLAGFSLLPYHLGRVTTYAVLGFLAALFAGHAKIALNLGWLPSVLLITGGALFLIQFLGMQLKINLPSLPRAVSTYLAELNQKYNAGRGYVMGIILGFLPCGFLLSALLVAASAPAPWQGALAMVTFGLAVMPALNLARFARDLVIRFYPQSLPHLRKGFSLASAITLFILAGVRLI